MGKECKCINPNGGGTKCPVQHLAVCIREKDKECYGECVPIPTGYSIATNNFNNWLLDRLDKIVRTYATENYENNVVFLSMKRISEPDFLAEGGRAVFEINNLIKIYVQFVYEFRLDEPRRGQQES